MAAFVWHITQIGDCRSVAALELSAWGMSRMSAPFMVEVEEEITKTEVRRNGRLRVTQEIRQTRETRS